MLNTSKALLMLIYCISQGNVITCLRCGGKYGTTLIANLLLSPTMKKFWNRPTFLKVMNEYRVARFYGSRYISNGYVPVVQTLPTRKSADCSPFAVVSGTFIRRVRLFNRDAVIVHFKLECTYMYAFTSSQCSVEWWLVS